MAGILDHPESDEMAPFQPLSQDLTRTHSNTTTREKLLRVLWAGFQLPFLPHTPKLLSPLRIFLLRCFGAEIETGCSIAGGVKVWIPWHLKMGHTSAIGFNTEIYNFAQLNIGSNTVISQRSYLCTSTHDYTHPHHPLLSFPISIGDQAWLAAGVFVAPGVTIGTGTVVGACSVVTRSMPAWTVCAGNPCRVIKPRILRSPDA